MGNIQLLEAEEIEIPDELSLEFERDSGSLFQKNLLSVVEHFTDSTDKAQAIVNNIHGSIINDLTSYQLYEIFKSGSIEQLPIVLKKVRFEIIKVDDCQLISLLLPTSPPITEANINWLRKELSALYPERLQSYTLTLVGPDGKKLCFKTWDLLQARQFDAYFSHYLEWLKIHTIKIGSRFQDVYEEIKEWLTPKVEEYVPKQNGFVQWFLTERLSKLELTFTLTFDKATGLLVDGEKSRVQLKYNLSSKDVIEQDVIDYAFRRHNELTIAKQLALRSFNQQIESPIRKAEGLSLRQVALLYIYQNKCIKRDSRADDIAKRYGYNSGEKLYNHYRSLKDRNDRINVDGRVIKPLINDIEAVLPYLEKEQRKIAENELNTIKCKIV
ncbi:hypothetical protein GCM10027341_33090 [Spirosoma knui]